MDGPKTRYFKAILGAGVAVESGAATPQAVLESLLGAAVEKTQAERALLVTVGPRGGLAVLCQRDFLGKPDPHGVFSRTVVELALRKGETVWSDNASADPRFADSESVESLQLQSVIVQPIVSDRRVVGAVVLDARAKVKTFTEEDRVALDYLGPQAARALELAGRARVHEAEKRSLRPRDLAARFGILGRSRALDGVRQLIESARHVHSCVLILGESGTGKELVARALHGNGDRAEKRFVAVNVAEIAPTLQESALFGHERGAFTGAVEEHEGLFQQADGGTLFLDEIGEASPHLQAALLRVLQEGAVRPVGGSRERPVDVRVIAATHWDLRSMVSEGTFRQDLDYRLDVHPVRVAPLRERREDVGEIAQAFLARHARETGTARRQLTGEALARLEDYDWPGNIRELENVLRRACVHGGETIGAEHLSFEDAPGTGASGGRLTKQVEDMKFGKFARALERFHGSVKRAAESLGISESTGFRWKKKLDRPDDDHQRGGS